MLLTSKHEQDALHTYFMNPLTFSTFPVFFWNYIFLLKVVRVPFFLSPEVVVQYLTRWDQCLRSAWGAAIAKIAQLLFSSQCCQGSLKQVLGKSLKIFPRIHYKLYIYIHIAWRAVIAKIAQLLF